MSEIIQFVGIDLPDIPVEENNEEGEMLDRIPLAIEVANITNREIFILTRRFGLDGKPFGTLQEVGKMVRLTRERVRTIECRALRKMRHPSVLRVLRDEEEAHSIEEMKVAALEYRRTQLSKELKWREAYIKGMESRSGSL